jgi:hypothetical protein
VEESATVIRETSPTLKAAPAISRFPLTPTTGLEFGNNLQINLICRDSVVTGPLETMATCPSSSTGRKITNRQYQVQAPNQRGTEKKILGFIVMERGELVQIRREQSRQFEGERPKTQRLPLLVETFRERKNRDQSMAKPAHQGARALFNHLLEMP